MQVSDFVLDEGYWYVGSPYSKYTEGLDAACSDVCKVMAWLLSHKIPCFSPIAHTHPIAVHGGIDPRDHSFWLPADLPMMKGAHGLIVAEMDGWEESYGVNWEMEQFKIMGKPIWYLNLETMEFN